MDNPDFNFEVGNELRYYILTFGCWDMILHILQRYAEGHYMPWTPKDREIESVLALKGADRYAYWIKKVADNSRVWGLWQAGGWALAADNEGRECIPVWPHERYAALCALDSWAGYSPKDIDMDSWLNQWIPGMEKDSKLVAIFPTPKDRGVVVSPSKLAEDIAKELESY